MRDQLLGVLDSDRQHRAEEIDHPLRVGGVFVVKVDAVVFGRHFQHLVIGPVL